MVLVSVIYLKNFTKEELSVFSTLLSPFLEVVSEFCLGPSWPFSGDEDLLLMLPHHCWKILSALALVLYRYLVKHTVHYLKQPIFPCYFDTNTNFSQ